jgi:hypothetical protein
MIVSFVLRVTTSIGHSFEKKFRFGKQRSQKLLATSKNSNVSILSVIDTFQHSQRISQAGCAGDRGKIQAARSAAIFPVPRVGTQAVWLWSKIQFQVDG